MAVYTRQYTQGVGWENEPSVNTPISAENLNQMDQAIMDVDAAVAAALADSGSGRYFSDHITSVNSSGFLITNTSTFYGTTQQNGDLLFLYSEIDAQFNDQLYGLTWRVKFGASSSDTGQILDYRDGATGGASGNNRFIEDIKAGSVLVLSKTPLAVDWGLRAIIPAAGGSGGAAYGNYIETIDRAPYFTFNTDISFSGSITAHDGEVFFLTSKAASGVNAGGWRVKMDWVDGSTSTYTRLLLMDINAETLSDVFTASIAEGDILVVKLVIGDPSDIDTWKCDLLARIRPSGGGASSLDDLSDVEIDNLIGGQVLTYDGNTGKWKNAAGGGGSGIKTFGCTVPSITALSNTLSPSNFSFQSADYAPANGDIIVCRINGNGSLTGASTHWNFVYTVNSETVTCGMYDARNGNAISDFDDAIKVGTLLVMKYVSGAMHVLGSTVSAESLDIPVLRTCHGTASNDTIQISENFLALSEKDMILITITADAASHNWYIRYSVGGMYEIGEAYDGLNGTPLSPEYNDALTAGDVLIFTNKYTYMGKIPAGGGGGASTLAGLTDTNIVSPSDMQYLKYNAISGKWENVSAAKTFVKATPNMTGPTTPSGVVSASSEYNINYSAWYAFDGVYGYDQQTWATSGGHTTGEWIQYLFGSAKIIKKIATVNRNEGNVRAIKTFKFQGSNDGTTFTDLANCEISSGTAGYRQEFTINNDTAYLYYRLYVTEPWISGDLTVGLAELELFEEVEVEVAELDDLVDVDFVTLADGQALVYDSTSQKWVNNKAVGTAYGGTGNTDGYIRTGQKANTQIGTRATIEGQNNTATRENNHVEGYNNTTNNYDAHAEGRNNVVNGAAGHAEGDSTQANNTNAHSEGYATTASGTSSHAQNNNTTASGANASAAGYFTTAGYENQFAIGKYNNNKSTSIFEVGIGTGTNAKANGLELDGSGNLKTAGTITDGNGNVLGQPVAVDGVWVISGETATLTVTTP